MERPSLYSLLALVLAVAVSVLGPTPAAAQEASIRGYVRDADTGETLLQANVVINGTSRGTATNNSGYYILRGLSPGTYTIVFSYVGYQTRSDTVTLAAEEERRLDVALTPQDFQTEEVVVTDKGCEVISLFPAHDLPIANRY